MNAQPSGHAPSARMRPSLDALADNWGWILLRGICAIIFGLLTFAWPGLTLLTLVMFYGAFALVDGGAALVAAVTKGAPAPRWWLALVGVIGIGAGLVTLFHPAITGIVLLYFIAGWSIAMGVLQIIGAISLRKEIEDEWLLIASGVLSVAFGILLMLYPAAGALSMALMIGIFAIINGGVLVAFAMRLRKHAQHTA